MIRDAVYILANDANYVRKLGEKIEKLRPETFVCRGYTAAEKLERLADEPEEKALLLVEEKIWEGMLAEERTAIELEFDAVCLLTEDEDHQPEHIWRYQRAEQIAGQLSQIAEAPAKREGEFEADGPLGSQAESGDDRCRIYGLYSPEEPARMTEAACVLADILAEEGSTLLIDFREFAGALSGSQDEQTMSDLLYLFSAGAENLLHDFAEKTGSFYRLRPFASPEDVWNLDPEEAAEFVQRIAENSECRNLVILLGPGKDPRQVLRLCRRICLLVGGPDGEGKPGYEEESSKEKSGFIFEEGASKGKSGFVFAEGSSKGTIGSVFEDESSKEKTSGFEEYLRKSEETDILRKIKAVRLPCGRESSLGEAQIYQETKSLRYSRIGELIEDWYRG